VTDHITNELDKLTVSNKYHSGELVHTTSGSGMRITHVGHGTLCSPHTNFHLKSILHVPDASKNLLFVNRFTHDNGVFLEFHPNYIVVKEQSMRKHLLEGRCENGLYTMWSPNKEVLGVIKPTESLCHHHLGRPATVVVQQVIHHHQLPVSKESNNK